MIAGMLLAARAHEAAHELPFSSVDRILAATKASRTRAYEIKQAIEARMQELERPPGRPRAEPAPAPRDARAALTYEALCFLMAHPGCLQVGEQRARYSDVYRHFVLGLRERHADVTLAELAGAIALPRGTLEDWLRSPLIAELGSAGEARDRFLVPLVAERDAILAANNGDVGAALVALVDRLVRAERTIDRHVWLDAAADLVAPHPPDVRIDLAKRAARRIHTTFALCARDRAHLEHALLRRLWPLT